MKDIKTIRLLLLSMLGMAIFACVVLYFLIQDSSTQDITTALLGSFWTGMFDGFMSPGLLIISLFIRDNIIYNVDVVDSITNYNFGFIAGLSLLLFMFLKK